MRSVVFIEDEQHGIECRVTFESPAVFLERPMFPCQGHYPCVCFFCIDLSKTSIHPCQMLTLLTGTYALDMAVWSFSTNMLAL